VKVARLGHVGIAVRDLDAAVEFYEEILGLQLTERFQYPPEEVGHGTTVAAGAFVRSGSRHHCLSIFELKAGAALPSGDAAPYGLHHIAFEMDSSEDLLALYRAFVSHGLEIVNARAGGPGNQPRFYARDPDGNLLEFYWGIDRIGWDGRPRAYDPIREIDLESYSFEDYLERRARDAAATNPST
jgi:catechol 2,3-dioxygenase